MFLGFVVAIAVFGGHIQSRWPLVAVTGVITLVMAIDDILDLAWWQKLVVVLGVGVAFVVLGISITSVDIPGIGMVNLGLLALPLTVVWVVRDAGLGELPGRRGRRCRRGGRDRRHGRLLAAINRIVVTGELQSGVVILSAALMGCCVGFLIFNLPPARIFMGDSGQPLPRGRARGHHHPRRSPRWWSASPSWCR